MLIVLFTLSTTYCQSSEAATAPKVIIDSFPKDSLLPVSVGPETWYAMPKERLAKIRNELDSLRRVPALVPVMDSLKAECDSIIVGHKQQTAAFEDLVKNYEAETSTLRASVDAHKAQIKYQSDIIKGLEKDVRKMKRKRKVRNIFAGILTTGLTGIALFFALK
jgi:hypothetical protein